MMKMIRKNLDDAVHGVSQVSKEGRQLSPQVALSKIWKKSRAMAENSSSKDAVIFGILKHITEERSKILPFAAFANF